MICEWCEKAEATYVRRADWRLCDDCRNRRSRFEWLVVGVTVALMTSLAWLVVCRW